MGKAGKPGPVRTERERSSVAPFPLCARPRCRPAMSLPSCGRPALLPSFPFSSPSFLVFYLPRMGPSACCWETQRCTRPNPCSQLANVRIRWERSGHLLGHTVPPGPPSPGCLPGPPQPGLVLPPGSAGDVGGSCAGTGRSHICSLTPSSASDPEGHGHIRPTHLSLVPSRKLA